MIFLCWCKKICKKIYFLDNQYYFWKIKFIVGDRTERVIGRVKVGGGVNKERCTIELLVILISAQTVHRVSYYHNIDS
jgi:hypothetical protein